MNKIDFVGRVLKILSKDKKNVIVVPETKKQKPWRNSDFEIYSENKAEIDFDLLVVDGKEIKNLSKLVKKSELLIHFSSLGESINKAETILDSFLNVNIDHTNFPEMITESEEYDDFNVRFSTIFGEEKVTVLARNEKGIEEIKKIACDHSNFYLSWISSLKREMERKDREIELQMKDIEALEKYTKELEEEWSERLEEKEEQRVKEVEGKEEEIEELEEHVQELKDHIEKVEEKREKEVEELEEDIEKLEESWKEEVEEKEWEIEKLRERKESTIENLRKEREELRKNLQDIKRRKNERITELEKELTAIKNSISYKIGSSLGGRGLGKTTEED